MKLHLIKMGSLTGIKREIFLSGILYTYVDEIIRHLMQVEGANVQLKLEVEVNAPDGIPSSTVRTVSENCKTLKITDFGFDD